MSVATHRSPRRDLALLWHQIRYEQLSFWRNPQSAFCLGVLLIWGAAGAIVAIRRFRWDPVRNDRLRLPCPP